MASPAIDYAGLLKTLTPGSAIYNLVSSAAANPNAPNVAQNVQGALSAPYLTAQQTQTANNALAGGGVIPTMPATTGIPPQFGQPTAAPVTSTAPVAQPVGSGSDVGGGPTNSNPGAGIFSSAQPSTLPGELSSTPINIGSLGLGSLNMGALLPALFSTGLGLWSMLGSKDAYNQAGNVVNNAEVGAGNEVNTTANNAANTVMGAGQTGNNLLSQLLGYYGGQTAPFVATGDTGTSLINSGIQPGGALNPGPLTGQQILDANPGYQFQLGEGQRQIEAANAAKGLTGSGPEEKQLLDYSQGVAQQAENTAFQQQQTQQQSLFQRLLQAAGIGQTGIGQGITSGEAFGSPQATNLLNAATTAGGLNLTGSQYQGNANATGAGAVAGGLIDANQAQQNFIQQIISMIPALFNSQGGNNGLNPFGLTGSDTSGLGQLAGILTGNA